MTYAIRQRWKDHKLRTAKIDQGIFGDTSITFDGHKVLCFKNKGNITAYIAYKRYQRNNQFYIHIQSLAVLPKYRKQKYGSKLLDEVIRRTQLSLTLTMDNNWKYYSMLKKFYRSRGLQDLQLFNWDQEQLVEVVDGLLCDVGHLDIFVMYSALPCVYTEFIATTNHITLGVLHRDTHIVQHVCNNRHRWLFVKQVNHLLIQHVASVLDEVFGV